MTSKKTKKSKKYQSFIRDLVYNNPRADRQIGSMDSAVPDNRMLYDDSKDEAL